MSEKLIVKCPTCRTEVIWDESSPYRPFCCKRCQLIDLGEWAAEEKRIQVKAKAMTAMNGVKCQSKILSRLIKHPQHTHTATTIMKWLY